MKTCKECKIEKPFTKYIKQGAYWYPKCNECRRAYQREYHQTRLSKKNIWKKKIN